MMQVTPPKHRALALGLFFLAVILIMLFGSQFHPGTWYETLNKSPLTPPPIVFPIVWTALYALMPFSIWLVYLKVGQTHAFRTPRNLFFIQLLLNGLWSYLFFGLHRPDLAMLDLAALWFSLALMLYSFSRVSRLAVVLQLPYFIWVSFAAWLNYSILALN